MSDPFRTPTQKNGNIVDMEISPAPEEESPEAPRDPHHLSTRYDGPIRALSSPIPTIRNEPSSGGDNGDNFDEELRKQRRRNEMSRYMEERRNPPPPLIRTKGVMTSPFFLTQFLEEEEVEEDTGVLTNLGTPSRSPCPPPVSPSFLEEGEEDTEEEDEEDTEEEDEVVDGRGSFQSPIRPLTPLEEDNIRPLKRQRRVEITVRES